MRVQTMDLNEWLNAHSVGQVIFGTTVVSGIGGVLAWMKANDNKWPPLNVLCVAFSTSAITALAIFLWLYPDIDGEIGKLITVCIVAGLSGSSGIEFIIRVVTGKQRIIVKESENGKTPSND